MNWLTKIVRPKIRALVRKSDIPENLWEKCPSCERMVFHRDLEANLFVCQHCGHHLELEPKARCASLFDDGAFEKVELPKVTDDPLKFRDSKRYADRLKEARGATGETDAAMVVHGLIGGRRAVVLVFDFGFMGGSMGIAVGDAVVAAARLAVSQKAPLIVFPASGGARMQEGALSLIQLPRTTLAVDEVKEAGLPYIVVLTNPTTGGVTASFAMLGDIALAEPGALICFTGPRVIEQTIGEKLPEGFQRAEYLLEHGMVDMVVQRAEIRPTLIRLLGFLRDGTPAGTETEPPPRAAEVPAPAAEVPAPAAESEGPAAEK